MSRTGRLALLCLVVIALCAGVWLLSKENRDTPAEPSVKTGNSCSFYSEFIQTESEALADMQKRGFDQEPVIWDYSAIGEYIGENEASVSNEKHPMYQTLYANGEELWSVISVAGFIYAKPVAYNARLHSSALTILSEVDIPVGYDSENNDFFDVTANKDEMVVITVDEINAQVLDETTPKVLSAQTGSEA